MAIPDKMNIFTLQKELEKYNLVVSKDLRKSFLVVLLNHFKQGNLGVVSMPNARAYEDEIEHLKADISMLEGDLNGSMRQYQQLKSNSDSFQQLAFENEEAI